MTRGRIDERRLTEALDAFKRRVRAAVADAVREERDAVLDRARRRWPVDTGESRDGLHPTGSTGDDRVTVGIGTSVEHTRWIKGDPWTRLVVEPMRAVFARGSERVHDRVSAKLRSGR